MYKVVFEGLTGALKKISGISKMFHCLNYGILTILSKKNSHFDVLFLFYGDNLHINIECEYFSIFFD